jgi:uncharacterized protein YbjQ (UPF0145 family)
MGVFILVTPTESLEGYKIIKYLDFITTNVVLGTNVLSDIGASFSDFFGGTSDIYQNKLEKIKKIGVNNLKKKAQLLGGNGILALRIDFDEISGKGKSMLMISVSGMAVIIKETEQQNKVPTDNLLYVSLNDLEIEKQKVKIINTLQYHPSFLSLENWNFILENPNEEMLPLLFNHYLKTFERGIFPSNEWQKQLHELFPEFIKIISNEQTITYLYDRLNENEEIVASLIKDSRQFSPRKILDLINSGKTFTGIELLKSDKDNYSLDDLKHMQEIKSILVDLPSLGRIEQVKSLIGGNKDKFICPNGHQNNVDVQFCEKCQENTQGLTQEKTHIIREFLLKISILEKKFSTKEE